MSKIEIPNGNSSTIKEQMHEALEHLHALETWWFEEGIVSLIAS